MQPLTFLILGGLGYYGYKKIQNPIWSPLTSLCASEHDKALALEKVKITSVPTPAATAALDPGMTTDQVHQVNTTLTVETDPQKIAAHADALHDFGHVQSAAALRAKADAALEAKALGASDTELHRKQIEAVAGTSIVGWGPYAVGLTPWQQIDAAAAAKRRALAHGRGQQGQGHGQAQHGRAHEQYGRGHQQHGYGRGHEAYGRGHEAYGHRRHPYEQYGQQYGQEYGQQYQQPYQQQAYQEPEAENVPEVEEELPLEGEEHEGRRGRRGRRLTREQWLEQQLAEERRHHHAHARAHRHEEVPLPVVPLAVEPDHAADVAVPEVAQDAAVEAAKGGFFSMEPVYDPYSNSGFGGYGELGYGGFGGLGGYGSWGSFGGWGHGL
jgi:hypothetical protein